MRKSTKAAVLLSLLSPFLAEILGGSTTPVHVLTNPLSFPLIWMFYGAGVLIVREFWLRWGRNYLSLLILGAAYGIFEEGLVLKSWFNPLWPDLGPLAFYGRVWGINTVWAVWLTIYHSIMSIAAPILILEIVYPELQTDTLMGRKGIIALFAILAIPSFLFYFKLSNYSAPMPQYILSIFLFLLLLIFAKKCGCSWNIKARHPFVSGLILATLLFLNFTFLPKLHAPPLLSIIFGILLVALLYLQMQDEGRYWTLFGYLSFWFVVYDVILELNGVHGEVVLGILTFVILLRKFLSKPY